MSTKANLELSAFFGQLPDSFSTSRMSATRHICGRDPAKQLAVQLLPGVAFDFTEVTIDVDDDVMDRHVCESVKVQFE
jgi:hypothetical protein